MDKFLTSNEVAKIFRVCRQTVINWAKSKKIPSLKIERVYRFRPEDIEQLTKVEKNL